MKDRLFAALALMLALISIFGSVFGEGALVSWSQENEYVYVSYGHYPKEKNGAPEAILWRVLKAENGEAYMLSEYIIDTGKADSRRNNYPGWEESELYQWLNSDFIAAAFDAEETIPLKTLADGGRVSLLTSEEVKDASLGFEDLPDRAARATAYAKAKGIDLYSGGTRYSPWWLRDVSTDNPNQQRRIIEGGKIGRGSVNSKDQGIRPCILVSLEAVAVSGGKGTKDEPYTLSVAAGEAPAAPTAAPELTAVPEATADAVQTPVPEITAAPVSPSGSSADTGSVIASTSGISPLFPALASNGFLPEGEPEFVYQDEENGVWLYASQTLRVEINRRAEEKVPLRWYEAEIWCQPESDMFTTYAFDEAKYTNHNRQTNPQDIAKQHHLVFSMNTDFFIYRVERDREESYNYPIGIVVRHGKLMYDRPKKATSTVYPPLDVVALYPDGEIKTFLNAETTGKALVEDGAWDVLSFGPVLMQNGQIIPRATAYGEIDNPRTAFGCVTPGHYWCVLMEGRLSKSFSKGASCGWMAKTMEKLGCQTAINLDGGQTACMIFMGKRINKIGTYDGKTTDRDRTQNELLGIGQSELVGN